MEEGGDRDLRKKNFPRKDSSRPGSSIIRGCGEGGIFSDSCSTESLISYTNFENENEFSNESLEALLTWLDGIQLSRSRKHLQRDFSDGVLMAEVIANFFPKMIELHNYTGASNNKSKKKNWELLNRKVFPKFGIKLKDTAMENICQSKNGFIEPILDRIRLLIKRKTEEEEFAKAKETAGGDCGDGEINLTEEKCFVHILESDDIPEFVIYRGQKFFPEELMISKDRTVEELREKTKEMSNKARRFETLVQLKENHLEDLTRQLHGLKIKLSEAETQAQRDEEKWEHNVHNNIPF